MELLVLYTFYLLIYIVIVVFIQLSEGKEPFENDVREIIDCANDITQEYKTIHSVNKAFWLSILLLIKSPY